MIRLRLAAAALFALFPFAGGVVRSAPAPLLNLPTGWHRVEETGTHSVLGGQVIDAFASSGDPGGSVFVLGTTTYAQVSRSSKHSVDVNLDATPGDPLEHITQGVQTTTRGATLVHGARITMCNRPGALAEYRIANPRGGAPFYVYLAGQASGRYFITTAYMHSGGGSADASTIASLRTLCVPPPNVLEAEYSRHR